MFHGMNNQFEDLQMKNGMTTTVIKITKSFTTVNSTTNDEMDWEFINVTNSATRMVKKLTKKKKTKSVSPAIIEEKKGGKKACFRCGIGGRRVDNVPFSLRDG